MRLVALTTLVTAVPVRGRDEPIDLYTLDESVPLAAGTEQAAAAR